MIRKLTVCLFVALAFATVGCKKNPVTPEKEKEEENQPQQPQEPQDPQNPQGPQDPPQDPPQGGEDTFESSQQAVLNMGVGWNLGNTLDSNSGDLDNMWIEAWTDRSPKAYETAWGQPETTQALIHMFKEAGFGAIRVPVTWYPHMGTITLHDRTKWDPETSWTGMQIESAWMARVKQVVDYVIDEGMYCIINVHHDTGAASTAWLVASEDGYNAAKTRYQALWEQIASVFKGYPEKLLFESYNEMLDPLDSWCFASFNSSASYDASVATSAYNAINNYAKLFTETVRATGGNNAYRNLIINTYGACSGDGQWNPHLKEPLTNLTLPEDTKHLAVQVHSYWDATNLGSQIQDIDLLFSNLDTHIVKRLGVPVIIGEWNGKTDDDDASARLAIYLQSKARAAGIATFWWMGLSDGQDRAIPQWTMPKTKDALFLQ